jgi:hypothetical protein
MPILVHAAASDGSAEFSALYAPCLIPCNIQEEGYIAKILVDDGTSDVAVGRIVLVICDKESDVSAVRDGKTDYFF